MPVPWTRLAVPSPKNWLMTGLSMTFLRALPTPATALPNEIEKTVDQTSIDPLIDESLGNPIGGPNKNRIVDLVDVPLVLEYAELQSILLGGCHPPVDEPTHQQPAESHDQRCQ